jgi:hypothetical protein
MATPKDLNALVRLLDSGGVAQVEVDGKQILCVSVYETSRSQAEMYLLRPGQRIPPHRLWGSRSTSAAELALLGPSLTPTR